VSRMSFWLRRNSAQHGKRVPCRRPRLDLEALETRTLLSSGLSDPFSSPLLSITGVPGEGDGGGTGGGGTSIVLPNPTQFVAGLYYDVLQRAPHQSEVDAWVAAINSGVTDT